MIEHDEIYLSNGYLEEDPDNKYKFLVPSPYYTSGREKNFALLGSKDRELINPSNGDEFLSEYKILSVAEFEDEEGDNGYVPYTVMLYSVKDTIAEKSVSNMLGPGYSPDLFTEFTRLSYRNLYPVYAWALFNDQVPEAKRIIEMVERKEINNDFFDFISQTVLTFNNNKLLSYEELQTAASVLRTFGTSPDVLEMPNQVIQRASDVFTE